MSSSPATATISPASAFSTSARSSPGIDGEFGDLSGNLGAVLAETHDGLPPGDRARLNLPDAHLALVRIVGQRQDENLQRRFGMDGRRRDLVQDGVQQGIDVDARLIDVQRGDALDGRCVDDRKIELFVGRAEDGRTDRRCGSPRRRSRHRDGRSC